MTKKKTEKTALVLSGGGSRGAYEAGVWQALTELGRKIDIVTGTSVGAINGAMVVQGDLELTVKLWREIETHMVFDVSEGMQPIQYAKEIITNKGAGTSGLKKLLKQYINEEAVRNSPIDFGVVVVELPGLIPHYVYKEDMKPGQIIDYIMASASLFPALHSYNIEGKEYIDGGYKDVMPINMALEKGATEVIAVYLKATGIVDYHSLKNAPNLIKIECLWDLGSTLIFDTDNARRIMRLGYLDAMKAYGVFDGAYYAFAKSTFDKTTTKMADATAKIFEMDPCLIYTKDYFIKTLKEAIRSADDNFRRALAKYRETSLKVGGTIEFFKDLKSITNKRFLAFLIAENIKEKGTDSIFITRTAIRLFPEYILAGRFLAKFDLV